MGYGRILRRLKLTWQSALKAGGRQFCLSWIRSGSQPLPLRPLKTLVFAPHQDDETLGCGGLIALQRQRDVPVQVVFLTDGAAAYGEAAPELVVLRQQEALTALATLGVAAKDAWFLGQPDGRLRDLGPPQRQALLGHLTDLLRAFRPEEIFVPHRLDHHPDHEATHEIVLAALAQAGIQASVWQYPIWLMWERSPWRVLGLPELSQAHHLNTQAVLASKRRALSFYRSQYQSRAGGEASVLPAGFLRAFVDPDEIFLPLPQE